MKQEAQKKYHVRHAKARTFELNDAVFVKNPSSGPSWLSGHITEIRGPVSYTVKLTDGRVVRKHINQIRGRTVTVQEPVDDGFGDFLPMSTSVSTPTLQNTSRSTAPPLRHSSRIRHPPSRYTDQ